MKKIIIPSLIIIPILIYFLFVVKLNNSIIAVSVEIIANDKPSSTSLEINVEDQDLIEEINAIIAAKRYLKQPLYDSWSRNEVDFEITIYDLNDNNEIVTWYRILLNTDDGGGVGNRSRIDVMSESEIKWRSFTVFLSDEQVEELTNCIQQYLP